MWQKCDCAKSNVKCAEYIHGQCFARSADQIDFIKDATVNCHGMYSHISRDGSEADWWKSNCKTNLELKKIHRYQMFFTARIFSLLENVLFLFTYIKRGREADWWKLELGNAFFLALKNSTVRIYFSQLKKMLNLSLTCKYV